MKKATATMPVVFDAAVQQAAKRLTRLDSIAAAFRAEASPEELNLVLAAIDRELQNTPQTLAEADALLRMVEGLFNEACTMLRKHVRKHGQLLGAHPLPVVKDETQLAELMMLRDEQSRLSIAVDRLCTRFHTALAKRAALA